MKSTKVFASFYCFLFVGTLVNACCGEIQLPNSVFAEPLYQAKVPQDVNELTDIINSNLLDLFATEDLTLTENFLSGAILSSTSTGFVWVRIELFASEGETEKQYRLDCYDDTYRKVHKFTYLGSHSNQYCIYNILQARQDPEGLCAPQQEYHSKAIFQKGRILIVLEETAPDSRNEQINKLIKMFAEQLGR